MSPNIMPNYNALIKCQKDTGNPTHFAELRGDSSYLVHAVGIFPFMLRMLHAVFHLLLSKMSNYNRTKRSKIKNLEREAKTISSLHPSLHNHAPHLPPILLLKSILEAGDARDSPLPTQRPPLLF